MKLARAARVILIGAPGVGKGTQSARLLGRYPQLAALSSGDLLRAHIRDGTPLGAAASSYIRRGTLVPDAMILRLILSELQGRGWLFSDSAPSTYSLSATAASVALGDSRAADDSMSHFHASDLVDTPTIVSSFPNPQTSDDPSASFLLDGFPRTASQAEALSSLIPINLAVHIHTPPSIILSRIAGRWVHAPSGRVYNETFNAPARPGYDDVTGERLTKRPDDDENVWAERLRRFEEESEPLLEFYQRKGVLVKVTGDSSDEITPKLCVEFERRFCS